MTTRTSQLLGSFVVGEVPPNLVYQFLDADGVAINLTGFGTITFSWGLLDSSGLVLDPTSAAGSLADATTGQVQYAWTGAEFATTGEHAGLFYVNDGTTQYASQLIVWQVCSAIGAPPVP